ncbi:hypothetical protein MPTK1_6g19360 [Marchantia polymorpha subsp. ruderalis]|uniref:PGG domain-containing protein n=2 Tax=Marchantia polymorpha TaxID=3197 RepID=A0AAF6BTS1_MARPO|nr:hypothetical protein MARPO_0045s0127 [Marchantia polymorpha]BBN15405.1 hypothetical protein Mp_6g19360 [Marchantia polymorpha subsp. ruderalis]|eukprot:PTQ39483.1 hypothetical protein MARPO_0045s0127 [Marchantia polymorpha]
MRTPKNQHIDQHPLINASQIPYSKVEQIKRAAEAGDRTRIEALFREWLLQGDDGTLVFHCAVQFCPHLVLELYPSFKDNIDVSMLISYHTLHLAAAGGHTDIVQLLIEHCNTYNPLDLYDVINGLDSDSSDPRHVQWTALHYASQNNHLGVVEAILRTNVPMLLHFNPAADFTTPLHLAIKPGDKRQRSVDYGILSAHTSRLPLIKQLLSAPEGKILLNMKNSEGNTPVHLAVEQMNVDVVELLIKESTLIATETNNEGLTPSRLIWDMLNAKNPKNSTPARIMRKQLRMLPDVQEEENNMMAEKMRYYTAANNFLVAGALLASVTFAGIISATALPSEFSDEYGSEVPAPPPPPQGSAPPPHAPEDRTYKGYYLRAISTYRGSTNLSFYFAIITVMASIRLIISVEGTMDPEDEIAFLRHSTVLISFALNISTGFAVVAFISGGLCHIPVSESRWADVLAKWEDGHHVDIVKSTMLTTTVVGILLILPVILIPLLRDDLPVLRAAYLRAWNAPAGRRHWIHKSVQPLAIAILLAGIAILIFFTWARASHPSEYYKQKH